MIDVAAPTTPQEISKAVETAVSSIEKDIGKGVIFKLGNNEKMKVEVLPTGIFSIDWDVLGVGGLPKGRIVEIYGPESGGKTTMALHCVASAQKAGGMAAFIDVEHSLDPKYAAALGVDVDNLLVAQPDYGEQALQIVEALVMSKAFSIIVVDSVAALIPKAELDGEIGDSNVGLHARLMSQAMRKLTGAVSKSGCVLLFINQIREKIGVMFGSPETTTGGRALKFYASVRLDVRRIGSNKLGDEVTSNNVRIKAVKNKVAPPFKETECALNFGKGFDSAGSLFDAAVSYGIINKSGSWFSYNGEKIGQGGANALAYLAEKNMLPEILKKATERAMSL